MMEVEVVVGEGEDDEAAGRAGERLVRGACRGVPPSLL